MNEYININKTKDELVLIVDENDNEINGETRKIMRKNNLPHRSSYIYIKNPSTNKYAIQIRSKDKEYCPGYFDLATGGVLSYGENMNESALRELDEEMGVKLLNKNDLKYIGKLYFTSSYSKCWCYVYYLEYEGDFIFNDGEVAGIENWTKEEINEKINQGSLITPDSIEAFKFLLLANN